jgi:TP901 family phage tail tape measure protein
MPRKSEFAAAATLVGKDQLSRPWKKALKAAEVQAGRSFTRMERVGLRTTRALNKGFRAAGKGARVVGKGARFAARSTKTLALATGGVVAAGGAAIDQFGKYELAVARLGNVLGTKGKDVVEEYGGSLKGLAVELGVRPLEVAEAAYAALSGTTIRSKDKLLEFLKAAGQASVAGGTDMASSVKVAAGVMEVFGDEVGDVNQIFNKLFVTEREGVTTFSQLADNLGDVTAFARSMGLTFDEILGPVASLTKTGLSTSAALTQLEAIIGGVTTATGKQRKAFKKFKIPFGADAVEKAGGFVKLLEKIGAESRKNKGAFQKLFGRKEAIKGTARLTQSGLESLQTTMAAFSGESTIFQDNFANMQKRTGFRVMQLKAGFSSMIGELGGGLAEGAGFAEISTDKIGTSFLAAGKQVRTGGKAFAEGFIGALRPGERLSDINWKELARDAGAGLASVGVAVGTLASALVTVVKAAKSAVESVSSFASDVLHGGEERRAQERAGAPGTIMDPLEAAIQREEARQISSSPFGGFLDVAGVEGPELKRLKKIKALRDEVGQERFQKLAKSPIGAGMGLGSFVGTADEQQLVELEASRRTEKARRARRAKTEAALGGVTTAQRAQLQQSVIEVKMTVEDKSSAANVDVKATSKNKNVKLPAPKVGKRKVAGG